jgi:type IV secretory pathway VirB4 component
MIFSILATQDEVLILDPEREYTALAELLGGEIVYISENSKTHINPLDLIENPDADDKEYDAVKAKLDFLLSFFSCILGNQEISPIQKTIIDNVMHTCYKKYSKPTLKEYYAELELYEKSAADEVRSAVTYLRQTLHLYVHGSMNVFANESNVNIHKRIVVYDIKELGKNLQTLGMMIVLENLWDKVAKNRVSGIGTRNYIDEMYLLFKSEQSANFFYELYKRARKWGGIPTGITQNVDDLLRSELARTMLSNTQFVVMLAQNATDREQLASLLHISPETMQYVNNSSSGSGLIYAGAFGTIPFDARIPSDTKLYQLISTKFGEQTASGNQE